MNFITTFTLSLFTILTFNINAQNESDISTWIDTTNKILDITENHAKVWSEKLNRIYFIYPKDSSGNFEIDSINVEAITNVLSTNGRKEMTNTQQRKIYRASSGRQGENRSPFTHRIERVYNSSTGTYTSKIVRQPETRDLRMVVPIPPREGIYKSTSLQLTKEIYFAVKKENLILFTPDFSEYFEYNNKGQKTKSLRVTTDEPKVMSYHGRDVIIDEVQEEVYFATKTNFNFYIHKLNLENGSATLLHKFDGLWPNPEWAISDGELSYIRDEQQTKIDLTKK